MKAYEKEILQAQLDNEKKVLNDLKESYDDALAQINGKIAQLLGRQDADLPHVIYQVEYQRVLKTQVQAILEQLQVNEFQTVSEYLTASYNEGFIASQYAMQCQGVPLIFPIDQEQVVQAIQHETKLSSPLYTELGHDIKELSKTIAGEISRGISAGQGYGEIARNLSSYANIPLNNAMRICRTESHRIQCKSAYDAQLLAREKGADILKEWNAYLDGKTRPHHRRLNGQIRELDEPFEIAGFKPMFPGDFGDPAEDCNCRCALLQRARWELDDEETQYLGDTSSMTEEQREEIAEKLGIPVDELDNYSESIVPLHATSLDDFRDKYNNIWHYEGSEEQRINLAIAEETRQGLLTQRRKDVEISEESSKIESEEVTDVDVKAIYDYMSARSYIVNDKLRNGTELSADEQDFIANLDNTLEKMPVYEGNLQRSLYFSHEGDVDEFMRNYVIGQSVVYNEYLSTTKGATYNPDGQVQIFIQDARNGRDISQWNESEQEVLYGRGSTFDVINIVYDNGIYYILLGEANE